MKKKCNWCEEVKHLSDFYKNCPTMCKNCRKLESRNNKFTKNEVLDMLDGLHNRLDSMEILIKIYKKR